MKICKAFGHDTRTTKIFKYPGATGKNPAIRIV